MKKFIKNHKKILIFVMPIFLCLIVSIIFIICKKGELWHNIFFLDKKDGFMDFFNSIIHSTSKYTYKYRAIYPPLVYYIYRFFAHLIPTNILNGNVYAIKSTYEGEIVYMLYMIICIYTSTWAIKKLNKDEKYSSLLSLVFLLSFPVLYCFQRGNAIILAYIFSTIFFAFYNSKNKYLKQVSLICLAISANIKLYPALYGLLLLKDKRYKDAAYCLLYGVLLFVLPFFSFGGFESMAYYVKNLIGTGSFVEYICRPYLISLDSTIISLLSLFMKNVNEGLINKLVLLLFPISIIPFLNNKKMWKNILLLSLLFICIPHLSFTYTLMFLFTPAIMIINDKESKELDYVYLILISLLFCTFGFMPKIGDFYFFVIIEKVLTIALLLLVITEGYITFAKNIKNRKNKSKKINKRKNKKCQK